MTSPNDKGDPLKAEKEQLKRGFFQYAKQWGDSSVPPTLLATLIFPQHARPFQTVPMLFPPMLLFTTYLNLQGFTKDAAGASAAWSGLYMLLASRRKHRVREWFGTRGIIRGATFAIAGANLVGGAVSYIFGKREAVSGEGEGNTGL